MFHIVINNQFFITCDCVFFVYFLNVLLYWIWGENCRWKCDPLIFFIKSWGIQTLEQFIYSSVFKCLTILIWDIWSISSIAIVMWPELFLISILIWSSSMTSGLLGHSWNFRLKFTFLNLVSHFWTVLSALVPSL